MRLKAAEELFFSDVDYHSWVERTQSEDSLSDVIPTNDFERPAMTSTPPLTSPNTYYLTHKKSSLGDGLANVKRLKIRASDARNDSPSTGLSQSNSPLRRWIRSRSSSRDSAASQSSNTASNASSNESRAPNAYSSSSSCSTVRLIRRKSTLPQVQFRRGSSTTTRRRRPVSAPTGNSDVARKIRAFERLSVQTEKANSLACEKMEENMAELNDSEFLKPRESQLLYERRRTGSQSSRHKRISVVGSVADHLQPMIAVPTAFHATHRNTSSSSLADAIATTPHFHTYTIPTPSSILPTPTSFYLPTRTPSPLSIATTQTIHPSGPPGSWPLPTAGLPPISERLNLIPTSGPPSAPSTNRHIRKSSAQHPYPLPSTHAHPVALPAAHQNPTLLRLTSGALLTVSQPLSNPWVRSLYLHGPTPSPPTTAGTAAAAALALHRGSILRGSAVGGSVVAATLELWEVEVDGDGDGGGFGERGVEEVVEFFEGLLAGKGGAGAGGWGGGGMEEAPLLDEVFIRRVAEARGGRSGLEGERGRWKRGVEGVGNGGRVEMR